MATYVEVQSPTNDATTARGGKVDKSTAWPIALIVSVVIIVVGTLIFAEKDISSVMLLVSGIVVPVLTAWGVSEVRALKVNTNGNYSRLQDSHDRLLGHILSNQPTDTEKPPQE